MERFQRDMWVALVPVATTLGHAANGGMPRVNHSDETGRHVEHLETCWAGSSRNEGKLLRYPVTNDRRAQAEQALHESRKELRRLSGLLCSIQEAEKRRIALDLHDGLGQTLNLIKLSIENAAAMATTTSAGGLAESLQQIVPRVKDALAEVRRIAMELRPPMLDDLGLLPTLTWFLREYEAASGGVAVDRNFNICEADVPDPLKITLFRILQEATSNIIKHSGATRVQICLSRCDGVLHLHIEDNGRGFELARATSVEATGSGLGLLSMQERASHSDGIYRIVSAPGEGTSIQIWWICEPDAQP